MAIKWDTPTSQSPSGIAWDTPTTKVGGVPVAPKPQISSIRQHALGALKTAGQETLEAAKGGLSQIGQGVARTFRLNGESEMFPGEGKTQIASGIINTLASPLAPIASRTIGPLISPAIQGIDEGALKIGGIPLQRAARYAGNAANVASLAIAPKVPGKIGGLLEDLTARSESQIQSSILKNYETGVKPLINAKRTPAQLENYREDVVSGVKSINANKNNLRFEGEDGEIITGQAPKTLQQFTDSIEQTKKSIYEQYDALAKQASGKGAQVNLGTVGKELDTVISNEALQIASPQTVQYARDLQARLMQYTEGPNGRFGGYRKIDASTAQDVIQTYNKSLEAFYRNPTYDTASRAAVDAMIVNQMRTALDETISSLTGTEYGALKKQYGALKAMEKDVLKATLRDARKNTKGLIDFSDILSGGQVVNGILTLNPGAIAQGATAKAIATYYKYLNNPNRAVEKLFNDVDQLQSLKPSSQVQTAPASTMSPTPSTNAMQSTILGKDSIIKPNEPNTNLAPSGTGPGFLDRAGNFLKSTIEHIRTNKEKGAIKNPFFDSKLDKEVTSLLDKSEKLGGQQQLLHLMSQADDMLNFNMPMPEGLTKASLRKNLRDTISPILDVDTFAWTDAKLSKFVAAFRNKIQSLDAKFDFERKVNNPFGANIRGDSPSIPKELEGLATEARKYNTAEEFVKAQELQQAPNTLYHGGRNIGDTGTLTFGNYGSVGSGQDSGAIFLTPSRKYAGGYVKSDGALYKANIDLSSEKIFDATKPADLAKLQKIVGPDAVNNIKETVQHGAADWATLSQYTDEIQQAGFTGAKFLERPGENIIPQADGSFKVSDAPVYSYGMFKEIPVTKVMDRTQLTDFFNKVKGIK